MKRIFAFILVTAIVFAVFPLSIFAANPAISGETVSAKPGKTVAVKVRITDNPGFMFIHIFLSVDPGLEVVGITNDGADIKPVGMLFSSTQVAGGYNVTADHGENITGNGVFFTVNVKVAENAEPGVYNVKLAEGSNGIFNYDEDPINFIFTNGKIEVKNTILYGDVNGSGDINGQDLVRLRKYLNGSGVAVDDGADVNGDGKINGQDLIRLRKFLLSGDETLLGPAECAVHNWGEWQTVTEPTCTEDGIKKHTCLKCGRSETDSIPALGHNYAAEVIAPTCTAQGYTLHTCTRCGDDYKDNYTDVVAHTYGEWTVKTEPTCTQTGIKQHKCTVCGKMEEETIPALGHNYVAEVVDPTCTTQGYTRHTCTRCGDHYEDNYTAMIPHNYGDWVVTVEPTCTANGERQHTCTGCGKKETEVVLALGHDYSASVTDPTCTESGYTTYSCTRCGHSYVTDYVAPVGHDYQLVVVEPTCTERGYTNHVCSHCGRSYITDYTDPKGHSYGEWYTTVQRTCLDPGERARVCTVCGYTETAVVEAGHDYSTTVYEASCTDQGYTLHTCIRCGDSYISDITDAKGHSFSEWSVTEQPTCMEDGEKVRICTRCGLTDYSTVPPTGHNYTTSLTAPTCTEQGYTTYTCVKCGDTYKDNYTDAKGHTFNNWRTTTEPTCTEPGEEQRRCLVCSFVETNALEKLWHDFDDDDVCRRCSYCLTVTDDSYLTYSMLSNGTYEVKATDTDALPEYIKIPTEHNGVSVTAIAENGFKSSGIRFIRIPNGITTIGESSFFGCSNLASMTIPESLTSIGVNAFGCCISLETIEVDSRNTIYHSAGNCIIETNSKTLITGCKNSVIPDDGSVTKIGDCAFYGCSGLMSAAMPYVNKICDDAFNGCSALKNISFERGVTIGKRAFYCCSSLTSITLPDTSGGLWIYDYAFYGCSSLESVTIGTGYRYIQEYAFTGCSALTSVSLGTIEQIGTGAFSGCTALTSIIIPYKVEIIYAEAFAGCTKLENVTMGSHVKYIHSRAFADCSSLKSITIPKSVSYIGSYAFGGCSALFNADFYNTSGWKYIYSDSDYRKIDPTFLENPVDAAWCLKYKYVNYVWQHYNY